MSDCEIYNFTRKKGDPLSGSLKSDCASAAAAAPKYQIKHQKHYEVLFIKCSAHFFGSTKSRGNFAARGVVALGLVGVGLGLRLRVIY